MLVSCNTSNSEPAEQLSNSPSAPPLCIALALALLPLGYQLPYSVVPQIITWPLSIREVSADDMRGLRENGTFFEFSLCLSRACLGKIIHFIYKWLKKCRLLTWER
jgi:hypothetical protein